MAARLLEKDMVIVFDTNVWVDYFTNRYGTARQVGDILRAAAEAGAAIVSTVGSAKDVYYLVKRYLKCNRSVEQTMSTAHAQREVAWACVREMRRLSVVVDYGVADVIEAEYAKRLHDDFEDDLILAAARHAKADILVTNDAELRAHAPLPAFGVAELAGKLARQGSVTDD